MNAWTTIGQYLLRRLNEAGVRHAFGVPGDFNLNLMQQIEDGSEIDWMGNCNELNAAYAADGYARLNGMAALCAQRFNGVAGAYSENVPLNTYDPDAADFAKIRRDTSDRPLARRHGAPDVPTSAYFDEDGATNS